MGEIGHNTNEWMSAFCKTMEENNIGWTFWPYKKMKNSAFLGIAAPALWDTIIAFSEANRSTYKEIREARPDQEEAWKTMLEFIESSKFKNCIIQKDYILALGLKPE